MCLFQQVLCCLAGLGWLGCSSTHNTSVWVSLTPIPERQSLKVGNTLFHTPLSTGRTVVIVVVTAMPPWAPHCSHACHARRPAGQQGAEASSQTAKPLEEAAMDQMQGPPRRLLPLSLYRARLKAIGVRGKGGKGKGGGGKRGKGGEGKRGKGE